MISSTYLYVEPSWAGLKSAIYKPLSNVLHSVKCTSYSLLIKIDTIFIYLDTIWAWQLTSFKLYESQNKVQTHKLLINQTIADNEPLPRNSRKRCWRRPSELLTLIRTNRWSVTSYHIYLRKCLGSDIVKLDLPDKHPTIQHVWDGSWTAGIGASKHIGTMILKQYMTFLGYRIPLTSSYLKAEQVSLFYFFSWKFVLIKLDLYKLDYRFVDQYTLD